MAGAGALATRHFSLLLWACTATDASALDRCRADSHLALVYYLFTVGARFPTLFRAYSSARSRRASRCKAISIHTRFRVLIWKWVDPIQYLIVAMRMLNGFAPLAHLLRMLVEPHQDLTQTI